jgi:hypothetical protein
MHIEEQKSMPNFSRKKMKGNESLEDPSMDEGILFI